MRHFLIQTIDGRVVHDFAFHLIKAIEFHNWLYEDDVYRYTLSETPVGSSDDIPIGTLEYVFIHLEVHHNVKKGQIRPINIPPVLLAREFSGRDVYLANKEDIPTPAMLFIKSNEMYKGFTDIVDKTVDVPTGEYLVSEVVDFESEWRAFVQHGKLVGLHHYLGDFKLFPDVAVIESMITAYEQPPYAYTLDVGVLNQTTSIIEVHPFVSCGLYGFHDYNRLPSMMIQGYEYMKREALSYGQQ